MSYVFYLLKKTSCNTWEQHSFAAFCLRLCHILHQECPHQESIYFCEINCAGSGPSDTGTLSCSSSAQSYVGVNQKSLRRIIEMWSSEKKLLAQNKRVTGKTSLIVGTTYVVIELEDLIKDGSPGTKTNTKLSCLIIFVLEFLIVFPGSVGKEGRTIWKD